ncbi:MAG: methyltransferase domain-containing protein, partial [Promethearchaeota archaeon]
MAKNVISEKGIWDYIVPEKINVFGPDLADPDKRALWCLALFYGGNTLRLWNEATELKIALLSACSLQEGQRIILIGKYADESGITQALHSLIGQKGHMSLEEIGSQAMAAFQNIRTASSAQLQWDFNYFDSLPDESVDRVILFGAASHVRNWKDCAQNIHRVLRSGGRVIITDAPWGGKELLTAADMDSHLKTILTALLSGIGLKEEELPSIGPEELVDIFKPLLSWSRPFSWRGLYLFYG